MTLPSDKEQKEILRWEDEKHSTTTSAKIKAITTEMLSRAEDRILKQVAPIQEKIDEHDGFIANFAQSFSHVAGFLQKATGKKR